MELKRVVITGIGAITPIGNNKDEYWANLEKGTSGSDFITRFDCEKFKTKFACEIKNFNEEDYFPKKDARKMDSNTKYGMIASDEAIKDAGISDDESLDKARIGVIWGSGIGGIETFQNEVIDFAKGDGTPRFNPFFIPKIISDITPGMISIKHGFRGPNYATVSACASSSHAMYDAYTYLRLGKAKIIVAGGSEAGVNICAMGGFNALKALSENNEDPKHASKPYDKNRDGFVLGEGAGAIILEELEHAKARGAKIYAELIGGGMSADAYHITAPHPEGLGVIQVMNDALEDANIFANQVDYINTHGTSTPLGDLAELKAVMHIFKENLYKLNISSTKSMTGHLLGAAGIIEVIACIFAINKSIIPPTINHTTLDEEIDSKINLTFNKAQKRNVEIAMSNTFGFGGHNTSIILKKFHA